MTLLTNIHRRELGRQSYASPVQSLYGDPTWIHQLDIVNELGGHSGCVNALSWSRSGQLLLSGSDDHRLNIHAYQPEDSTKPFSLRTSLSTGHTANIFSAKFMPHSADRTVVCCAGDGEVRVFDIEASGSSQVPPPSPLTGRTLGLNTTYEGVRYLGEANTNARVYRSHADRVKRIVTESSPHLFLTCSEDGEVRQWDLRQPSSAYPARRPAVFRFADSDSNVPPPLISYRNSRIGLNTISCSPSQPHYIALGGDHLHAFLHDRRMVGRDRTHERGLPSVPHESDGQIDAMGEATRCVRRFAPNGKTKMGRMGNDHITACKISDANPNEMIVSWSADNIYSFDLIRSPDHRDESGLPPNNSLKRKSPGRARQSRSRRRRSSYGSKSSGERYESSAPLTEDANSDEDVAGRPQTGPAEQTGRLSHVGGPDVSDAVNRGDMIFIAFAEMKTLLLEHESSTSVVEDSAATSPTAISCRTLSRVLRFAKETLPLIDFVISTWRYPVLPTPADVIFIQMLRDDRERTRRFVQAVGAVARLLLVLTPNCSDAETANSSDFAHISPLRESGGSIDRSTQFCLEFLKAIIAWLDPASPGILEVFTRDPDERLGPGNFRFTENSEWEAVHRELIPHLLRLAGRRGIPNADASRFETDERRFVFRSETDAVRSFSQHLEGIGRNLPYSHRVDYRVLWVHQVARGLLLRLSRKIQSFQVYQAFSGDMRRRFTMQAGRSQEDIDPDLEISEAEDQSWDDAEMEDQETDEDSEEDDEYDAETIYNTGFLSGARDGRASQRAKVDQGPPCIGHSGVYAGHCNVRTVKDVNYFGLQDEYVVSGSDSGHVFIWDRKSGTLLNILEGDTEVVNVVQGHPYEPMLAISGIDLTIKIFSPDARAQADARAGINVLDNSCFGPRLSANSSRGPVHSQSDRANDDSDDEEGTVAPNGLASRKKMDRSYEIMARNKLDQQNGRNATVITRGMLMHLVNRYRTNPPGADLENHDDDEMEEDSDDIDEHNDPNDPDGIYETEGGRQGALMAAMGPAFMAFMMEGGEDEEW